MFRGSDYPLLVFGLTFSLLIISTVVGATVVKKLWPPKKNIRDDFGVILAAVLTLLGLIVGFTFSMATSRYDQRKNLEEAEANAIGTEFLRVELMPAADAARARALLRHYFDQRLLFYQATDSQKLAEINARTAELQAELWSSLLGPVSAAPTPPMALVVAGMNDVLNSQGYTQAAWWNRIPRAAWLLMLTIAICCHVLIGYGVVDPGAERMLLFVLPLVTSISFFLIADIDSPRGGIIRVQPQNLMAIADSLKAR
jgi:hypothetical protein